MDRFTNAIEMAIDSKNWYAALYLALALPDICARLESVDGKTNGSRYAAWFDKYMGHRYAHVLGGGYERHVFLSGGDCYALRCAALHEGAGDISSQRAKDALERFHFTVVSAHCNQIGTVLQVDIPTFCQDICEEVGRWASEFKRDHPDKLHRLSELLTIYEGPHSMGGGIFFG